MKDEPLLPRFVDVEAIPSAGLTLQIDASPAERERIAAAFRLVAVTALGGAVEVSRDRDRTVRIDGRVVADIVQSCVVTLEPVAQHIDETIDLRLVPAGEEAPAVHEVVVEVGDDEPETYAGSSIDVGALALEHVAMAIDPYPRVPGAELPAGLNDEDRAADSPFAALRKLKPEDGR